jgi:hypothetical protein
MNLDLHKIAALGVCLSAALVLSSAAASASADAREYRFDVYLDDRRIGEHHYEITGAPGSERVRSQASFEFKLLFVTLYRYRHVANERWQGGCLTELTSVTNDNGKNFEVEAGRNQAHLLLTRLSPDRESREISTDCPATFAYWDLQRLDGGSLINTQTGEFTPTRLIREDSEPIDGENATRYRLEVEGLAPLQLWYRTGDDAWLRLSTRRDGRLLEYRRVGVAQQAATGAAL